MGMIKSDQELAVSKKLLKKIDENYSQINSKINPAFINAAIFGQQAFRQDIADQIKEYKSIKEGKIPEYFFNLKNIGILLIALRIKSGLTQSEFASKMGVAQSQVSRDETNDYHGISITKMNKILEVLDVNLDLCLKK